MLLRRNSMQICASLQCDRGERYGDTGRSIHAVRNRLRCWNYAANDLGKSTFEISTQREKIRESRTQLLFKEQADKVSQLAGDLGAASYAFLWVTWSAEHDDLDDKMMATYYRDIKGIMPRLYADYISVAALDDKLGDLAGSLVDAADELDEAIGKAALNLTAKNIQQLGSLQPKAMKFADEISRKLADEMKRKRLAPN